MRNFLIGAAALAGVLAGSGAQAIAIGDTVTCSGDGGFSCSGSSTTVSAASEFFLIFNRNNLFSVDFAPGSLTVNFLAGSAFLGSSLTATFADTTSPISAYSLTSATGTTGFDASDLSLTGGALTLNFGSGATYVQGSQIVIALPGAGAGPVPEPASWAMMIGGFGAIGTALRRRPRRRTRFC